MKNKGILILTFLMMSFFSIAQSNPTPEDAPSDFAQRGGPPPPPPAPIDEYVGVFLIMVVVLAFLFFYNNKKVIQD